MAQAVTWQGFAYTKTSAVPWNGRPPDLEKPGEHLLLDEDCSLLKVSWAPAFDAWVLHVDSSRITPGEAAAFLSYAGSAGSIAILADVRSRFRAGKTPAAVLNSRSLDQRGDKAPDRSSDEQREGGERKPI